MRRWLLCGEKGNDVDEDLLDTSHKLIRNSGRRSELLFPRRNVETPMLFDLSIRCLRPQFAHSAAVRNQSQGILIPVFVALIHHEKVNFPLRNALISCASSTWSSEVVEQVLPAVASRFPAESLIKVAEHDSFLVELILQNTHLYSLTDLKETLTLKSEHVFFLYEVLSRAPPHVTLALLENKKFPIHPALSPGLLAFTASVREFSSKPEIGFGLSTAKQQALRTLVANTQKESLTFYKKISVKSNGADLQDFLLWICVEPKRIKEFLTIWASKKTVEGFNSYSSASILAALGGIVDDEALDLYLDVLIKLVEEFPDLANDFIIFCMTLYATTPAAREQRKEKLLGALIRLTVHRMAIAPVLKFLVSMCQQKKSVGMMKLLGDLFEKHERVFPSVLPFLSLDLENESFAWNRAKMDVIRRICKMSERCEEFLEALSSILNNPENPFFVDAIYALADMCRQEIIDFEVINRQLRKKYDVSVEAAVAYSDLLSTASTNSEKASVWTNVFADLWRKTADERIEVKCAAWKSLACFNPPLFLPGGECYNEEIDQSGPNLASRFSSMTDVKEKEAFAVFARKVLGAEIETYSRALYTRLNAGVSHDPFNATIRLLREEISDDPFLRLGMLVPLCASINLPVQRAERILHIFTESVVKIERKVCEGFGDTMLYYGIWKSAIQACFDAQIETGTVTPIRVRDQLTVGLKNSLQQAPCALINTLVCLPFVAMISTDLIESECSEDERKAHEKWILSVLEFLMNATSFKYQLVDAPIFRFFEKETVRRSALITSFSGISALMLLNWAPTEMVISHFGCPKDELIEFVVKNCPKSSWIQSNLVDALLFNQKPKPAEMKEYSAFDIRVCGYVVGAAPVIIDMVLESVSRHGTLESVKTEEDVTKAFESFLVLNDGDQLKATPQFAKKMEKLCRGNKEAHKDVISGLMKHQIGLMTRDASTRMANGYESTLPESSALRAVAGLLRETENIEDSRILITILIDHKRSDGRRFPPIDWTFLLKPEFMNSPNFVDFYRFAFQVAAEQKAAKLLCKFSTKDTLRLVEDEPLVAKVIAEHIDMCTGVVPYANISSLLEYIFSTCGKTGWNSKKCKSIAANLAQLAQRDKMARHLVSECLPKISNMADFVENIALFDALADVEGLHSANGCMVTEFWTLVKGGKKLDLEMIYGTLVSMEADLQRTSMLLFAYCSGTTPNKEDLVSTGFDLISVKTDKKNIDILWNFFLSLAVSVHVVPFPLVSYAAGDQRAFETQKRFAFKYFEKFLQLLCEDETAFKAIVRFLANVALKTSIEEEEAIFGEDRSQLRKCLKQCINVCPEPSIKAITEAGLFEDLFA
ncbi:hypothetical protein L596_007533 [Steinernema carpocapsae]|uniref:DUF3730 domain-containing protein n=1 Tax=Steinernema carpocapsae TaxID=34508 RepID=A0A4V6A608_STECR|nr:hypothetical protein L596_007533 [Steinernema carpocapsae]